MHDIREALWHLMGKLMKLRDFSPIGEKSVNPARASIVHGIAG